MNAYKPQKHIVERYNPRTGEWHTIATCADLGKAETFTKQRFLRHDKLKIKRVK